MTFSIQYAKEKGLQFDIKTLKKHSSYIRDSLVMYSIGEYAETQYLEQIIKNSIVSNHKD